MNRIVNRINHLLTRMDAWEASSKAPIRKFIMPISATGLGMYVLANDYRQAPTAEQKKKVAIRDVAVLGGTIGGLFSGIALARSRFGAEAANLLAKLIRKPFDPAEMSLSNNAKEAIKHKPWAKSLQENKGHGSDGHDHHHHHDHGGHDHEKPTGLAGIIDTLFNLKRHDHGIAGIIWLESLAAGSILGAVLTGGIADKVNGEDLKKTMPAKLYESIFQFMGNITLCTVSILLGSWAGKNVGKQLLKSSAIEGRLQTRMLNQLKSLAKTEKFDKRRVPMSFTEIFERAWVGRSDHPLALKTDPSSLERQKQFKDLLLHWFEDNYPKERALKKEFSTRLDEQLKHNPKDKKALREIAYAQVSQANYRNLQTFKTLQSLNEVKDPHLKESLQHLTRHRFEKQTDQLGMLAGFGMGIFGGAWVSNRLNDFLQRHFHLAKAEYTTALVNPKEHNKGLLGDKLGNRGIHWWDMILHLDDLPSALYLAGVEVLEPFIRILYGMSGYLSGIAGTNYTASTTKTHDPEADKGKPNPFIEHRRFLPAGQTGFSLR